MNQLGRYKTPLEKEYFSRREEFIDSVSNQEIADNPFLFATRQSVTDYLVRIELFERIRGVSGHIVECGVNRGNSFMLYSHLSSIHEPYGINRKIIGFDTFEGFRSISSKHDPADISENDFRAENTHANLVKSIALYDDNRPISHMSRCELVKGDAVDTIPEYVKSHPEMTIALLHLDFDIYEPTLVALENFFPLVCKGGIVVLDEFNYDKFPGETAALKDFLNIGGVRLEKLPYAPFSAFFEK